MSSLLFRATIHRNLLCHGGPIAEPDDAQYVIDRCAIEGFYGASSMERLPTEKAITNQVREFMALGLSENRRGLSPLAPGTAAPVVAEQKGTVPLSAGGSGAAQKRRRQSPGA